MYCKTQREPARYMVKLFRELNGDHLFTKANSISGSKNTRKTTKLNPRYLFCIDVNAKVKSGGAYLSVHKWSVPIQKRWHINCRSNWCIPFLVRNDWTGRSVLTNKERPGRTVKFPWKPVLRSCSHKLSSSVKLSRVFDHSCVNTSVGFLPSANHHAVLFRYSSKLDKTTHLN